MRAGIWIALSGGVAAAVVLVLLAVAVWPESSDEPEMVAQDSESTEISAPSATTQADNSATEPLLMTAPALLPAANSLDRWMFITLATMALTVLISSTISFYLYYWRKILLSEPHLMVPEQLGEWVGSLARHVNDLTEVISSSVQSSEKSGRQTSQEVSNLSDTFMTMQHALDEREREIQRLKRGYDSEIFRKFVARFIRVDQAVEDFQRLGSADEAGLDQIRRLLGDAFAECNIECFQPELGSDYRHAFGVADQPKKAKAECAEDDFKIAEILESGYLIRSAENSEVIRPAKVRIYAFQERDDQADQVGGKT